jgi:SAM-dependent methyltransferase
MNAVVSEVSQLRLDLGCGKNKREGFTGVDRRTFPGVDVVADLLKPWPWGESTVTEIHASHMLEHFTGVDRVHVFNEMYRVLIPGGKATIITPHWASNRAFGDFTHQWPPVSEMLYFYVSKAWRDVNAPDNDIEWNDQGYRCDFDATWGYVLRADLLARNTEYQMFALGNYKEAASDLIATLAAKK